MTEDKVLTEQAVSGLAEASLPEGGVAKSPGSMLEAQRVVRGLEIADVAQRLKYGVRQIEALERDDFAALPGTTFVRGMIRGYAKLLELDSGPILNELDRRHIPAQVSVDLRSTSIPFPVEGRRSTRVYGIVSIMAFVAALLVAYEWQFGGFSWLWQVVSDEVSSATQSGPDISTEAALKSAPLQSPVDSTGGVAESSATAAVPSANDASPSGASGVSPGHAQQTPANPPAALAGMPTAIPGSSAIGPAARQGFPVAADKSLIAEGDPRALVGRAKLLALRFERDSWVEIKQGNGKILMSQLNRGGTEQTVEGLPPFELIIGNAPSVRLVYNNTPVDLRPHLKVDVARLTLE